MFVGTLFKRIFELMWTKSWVFFKISPLNRQNSVSLPTI